MCARATEITFIVPDSVLLLCIMLCHLQAVFFLCYQTKGDTRSVAIRYFFFGVFSLNFRDAPNTAVMVYHYSAVVMTVVVQITAPPHYSS